LPRHQASSIDWLFARQKKQGLIGKGRELPGEDGVIIHSHRPQMDRAKQFWCGKKNPSANLWGDGVRKGNHLRGNNGRESKSEAAKNGEGSEEITVQKIEQKLCSHVAEF